MVATSLLGNLWCRGTTDDDDDDDDDDDEVDDVWMAALSENHLA